MADRSPPLTSMDRLIEKALAAPDFDVEKLERLFALAERTRAAEAEQGYNEAMSAVQAALAPIAADSKNPQTKSKYASYTALDKAVRPIYTQHGFSLSFGTDDSPLADHIRVTCRVAHRDGHKEREHVDMPADGKGAKGGDVMTKTHAAGSAFSYGQRYLLKLIFNLAVGDDDDGNRAGGQGDLINEHEVLDLLALMEEVGADRARFLNFLRVDTLAHLPRRRLPDAIKALEAKRKA
ncbi:ERF family protein [Phenylobacterium sp. LjRoot164]|uniref:ERF family protein n=1 Tax=unclassified Phenylobacterium TaxID=2640670 RepID=UPI003ECC42BE